MIVVTGATGFIGKNLVKKLNSIGLNNLILVDKIKKNSNLKELIYKKFYNYKNFIKLINCSRFNYKIDLIFHLGANSSTTEKNLSSIIKDNFFYSKDLIDYCLKKKIKIIYASSASIYGINNSNFTEKASFEPSNYYSLTKALLDIYVLDVLKKFKKANILGLRYFNVYGPGESHKKNMASVIYHFNNQLLKKGFIKLFKGCDGYKDGEQVRDFVHVYDCVDINIWFMKKNINGIYNVGTGKVTSFNFIAKEICKYYKYNTNIIKYIDMPLVLKNSYQNYTKASLAKLRKIGYKKKFIEISCGIKSYLNFLKKD
jgi:ADP-L-glycero-D-manno-heptose 6-epimerase